MSGGTWIDESLFCIGNVFDASICMILLATQLLLLSAQCVVKSVGPVQV